jgi:hypothetical protein
VTGRPSIEDITALQELMFPSASQAIRVAAELGIADLLAGGPLSIGELAAKAGAAARPLAGALRVLTVEGVFAEPTPGVFANTTRSNLLRAGVPDSQHVMSGLGAADWLWASYGALGHSVRTGAPAFSRVYEENLWAWLGEHPDEARQFNDAMNEFSATLGPRIVSSCTAFADAGVVADLGGGTGTYLANILETYPSVRRGVLVDQPPVIEQAKARKDIAGLIRSGRLDFFAGDFLADVPTGIDLYVTKQVTHSWSDETLVSLLKRCRDASPNARIAAAELVRTADESRFVRHFDVMMYVTMAGFLRTEQEYATLFAQAGYELTRVEPTNTAFSIIEAAPEGTE